MILDTVRAILEEERLAAMLTVVDGEHTGMRAVVEYDVGVMAGELPESLLADVIDDAARFMENERNGTLVYEDGSEVFIETLAPQPHLVIFGAVHIAQALCHLATDLGYAVTVSDSRAAFITPERFPEARRLLIGWPDAIADELILDRRTFVVLLSHDARFEDPVYPMVLESPVRYIGAMGSRRTHAKRVERLTEAGIDEQAISRIHGPVGLDLGAESPEEVAVSILAEMTQVRYGSGTGLSLQGRPGRIHRQRTEDEGDV